MATILTEERKLQADGKIQLFVLDFAPIGNSAILRFHNGVLNNFQPVYFQGQKFEPWEIEAEGFELSTDGLPSPILRVRNVRSLISSTMKQVGGSFKGAKLIRKRTYQKFLDGQPEANPTQESRPDIFYIARKKSETRLAVEFELKTSTDLRQVKIPLRVIQQNTCSFEYRDGDCPYAGPYVDIDGNPTPDASKDECSLLIKNGCKPRFGENAVLPFGGFPGARSYS